MSSGHWFVASERDWGDDHIVLDTQESHHAIKVLRVAPPDVITITDGRGRVATCTVSGTEGARLVAEILDVTKHSQPQPELVVYQGAAKSNKADAVIERLAELGASEIRVFESERTIVRWPEQKRRRLEERWRSIARSAAKQSRNSWTLTTGPGLSWPELVEAVAGEPMAICLWEQASRPLRTALVEDPERVALVVGPEGGLSHAEAEALAAVGAVLVSLGPTILRTENAPVVAASAVLFHYGRLG